MEGNGRGTRWWCTRPLRRCTYVRGSLYGYLCIHMCVCICVKRCTRVWLWLYLLLAGSLSPEAYWRSSIFRVQTHIRMYYAYIGEPERARKGWERGSKNTRIRIFPFFLLCFSVEILSLLIVRKITDHLSLSRNRSLRRFPHWPHPLLWLLSPVILSALPEGCARPIVNGDSRRRTSTREWWLDGGWGPRSSRTRSLTGGEFHVLFDVGAKFQTGPRNFSYCPFSHWAGSVVRDGLYE